MQMNEKEFLTRYADHPVTEVTVPDSSQLSPFIVIRHGGRTVVINPLGFDDHLSVDAHTFIDGQPATAGVFGMTEGSRWELEETGTTSHGWPSASLVTMLVGQQATS